MTSLRAFAPTPRTWTLAALPALLIIALAFGAYQAYAQLPPPATPSHVTVARADGTLTASWPAVSGATSYHVTYTSDKGKSWSLAALDHTSNSIAITGVDNSKSYIVGVRAKNSAGGGGWRNSPTADPYNQPGDLNPPSTPGTIALSRADGTLTASWPAVSGATSYHITYTSDKGKNWSLAALNHPAENRTNYITISEVDNNKTYIVGVRARNSAGDSGWRNSPPIGQYDPPKPPPDAPARINATGSDESVTLRWSRPNGDVTGYQYQVRKAPPAPGWSRWQAMPGSGGHTTAYTINKLENGTEYRFKLRAMNDTAAGPSAPTSAPWYVSATPNPDIEPPPPQEPPSAPASPASVTATRVNGNIVASWHHSKGATGYDVRYSTDNGSAWKLAAWHWTTSVITIKGASGDKTYIVGVRARNHVGVSAWTTSNTVAALPQTVSVSNLDKPLYAYTNDINAENWGAVAFTTGTSTAGYTLVSFTTKFSDKADPNGVLGDIVVSLHDADNAGVGVPASATLATLDGSNPDTPGEYTYTCSGSGCALSPGTTYFAQFKTTGGANNSVEYYKMLSTGSDDETLTPVGNGWSLADTTDIYKQDSGWILVFSDTTYLKVVATANP